MNKKRVFSAIQPSGIIHLGNYFGAITQWVKMSRQDRSASGGQNEYESIFSIANLHAITIKQNPKELKENTYKLTALLLACGIDTKRAPLFIQSHVPEHTELTWILNTITYMGELERMTQYKEKAQSSKLKAQSSVGLFDYPVLMAADILLYDIDIVPVGEDQIQHVELCRDLAKRFNSRFGETFKIPKVQIQKESARIMGLDNPEKKMSKSAQSSYNYIALTDSPNEIKKKISKAQTDSGREVVFDEKKVGLYNLLTIYKLFSEKSESEIEKKFSGRGYGDFKKDLAELIIEKLKPIQSKYEKLIDDKSYLEKILENGKSQVTPLSSKTLSKVKNKIGLI